MSKYFPSDDRDDWSPITINGNLPLLGMVSSNAHPGLYQCRWKYKRVNGKIVPMQVILRRFDQVDNYPHLTIDFDASTGVIIHFHASELVNGQKISYGKRDIEPLMRLLVPMFIRMSTNDALTILDAE